MRIRLGGDPLSSSPAQRASQSATPGRTRSDPRLGPLAPTRASASASSSPSPASTRSAPRGAAGREPPRDRSPDEDGPRSEGESADDVGAAADAAVDVHLARASHGLDDLWKTLGGRDRAVSWRPPWFETTMPAAPASTERRASSPRSTPLTTTGSPESSESQPMSAKVLAASWKLPGDSSRTGMPSGVERPA